MGVLVAWWSARFLIGLVPASMPIPRLEQLHPNLAILAFTLGVTVATAFLVGLVPAFQASREDVALSGNLHRTILTMRLRNDPTRLC